MSVVTTKFGIPETMNGVGKRPLKFESAKNRWPINLAGYRVRARRFCAAAEECAVCLAGNKVLSQDLEQVHPSPGDKNLPSATAVATCARVCVCVPATATATLQSVELEPRELAALGLTRFRPSGTVNYDL